MSQEREENQARHVHAIILDTHTHFYHKKQTHTHTHIIYVFDDVQKNIVQFLRVKKISDWK